MSATSPDDLGRGTRTLPKSLGEAAQALRELAEPWPSGSSIKSAIERAAKQILVPTREGRSVRLSYWRAFDLWYGKARRVEQFERDAIATALDKKRREAVRNDLQDFRKRLLAMEARLNQIDPEFHGEATDALGSILRRAW